MQRTRGGQTTAEKFVTNTNLAQHRVKRTVALTARNTHVKASMLKGGMITI